MRNFGKGILQDKTKYASIKQRKSQNIIQGVLVMKRFVLLFILFASFAYGEILEQENRRILLEKREQLEKIFEPMTRERKVETEWESFLLKIPIQEITVEGNTLLPSFRIRRWKAANCPLRSEKELKEAMQTLENLYMEQGYVTTRVSLDLEKSDFEKGKVTFFVQEGKVEKILYDGKEKPAKTLWTFPWRQNHFLNIRDLDQGMDNLGEDASFRILPGEEEGKSILEVKRKRTVNIFGEVNYNNMGQKTTGKHRIRTSVGFKNILGLNETLSGYYQTKLQRQKKEEDNKNYQISLLLPFQYYQFSYQLESSSYLQTIPALGRKYSATGDTKVQRFGLRRTMHRNEHGKWDFSVQLALKEIKNYMDDIKLITGSRRLSIFSLENSYIGRLGGGLFQGNIGVHFGLRQFGATKDRELWYHTQSSPKAQFRKYTLDMSWYRPFASWHYRGNLALQYSNDILHSSERLSLGDETTVRGFQDFGVQGERGFYFRNELGYDGWKMLRPFIAYDIGEVRRVWKEEGSTSREMLQGISAGLLFSLGNWESRLVFSKAIDFPSSLHIRSHETYISVSYRF